jgi:hypothetical protein
MDTSAKIKEEIIRDYISNVNFKSDKFSVIVMKEDLKRLLKEEPGIHIGWEKNKSMNEKTGQVVVVEKVGTVTVAFSDGDNAYGKPKVHSVLYYI